VEIHPNGQAYIIELDVFVSPDLYCLENTLDEAGDLTYYIRTCLFAPVLPKCCAEGQVATVTNGSVKSGLKSVKCADTTSTNDFNFKISIDKNLISFEKLEFTKVQVHCRPDFELVSTIIDPEDSGKSHVSVAAELNWKKSQGKDVLISHEKFCLDNNDGETKAYFCYQDPYAAHAKECKGHSCVRKCCKEYENFFASHGCDEFGDVVNWMPEMYNQHTMHVDNSSDVADAFKSVHGLPLCDEYYMLDATEPYALMSTGELKVLSHRKSYSAVEYCIDNMYDGVNFTNFALLCFQDEHQDDTCFWAHIIQVVALLLSCLFIVATLFVYLSVAEILRRLPSKCVVSEGFALLLSFICLVTLQVLGRGEEVSGFCIAVGESLASYLQ